MPDKIGSNSGYMEEFYLNFNSNLDSIMKEVESVKKEGADLYLNFTAKGLEKQTGSLPWKKNFKEGASQTYSFAKNFYSATKSFTASVSKFAGLPEIFTSVISNPISGLISGFKKVWSDMQSMFKYSFMTDQSVRQTKLTYGLSDSEAFGLNEMFGMNFMGISSMEDVFWATSEQLEIFNKGFTRLNDFYKKQFKGNEDLALVMSEFQLETQLLKYEFMGPFLTMLTENKDHISAFLQKLPDYAHAIVEWLDNNAEDFAKTLHDTVSKLVSFINTVSEKGLWGAMWGTKSKNDTSNAETKKWSLGYTKSLSGGQTYGFTDSGIQNYQGGMTANDMMNVQRLYGYGVDNSKYVMINSKGMTYYVPQQELAGVENVIAYIEENYTGVEMLNGLQVGVRG